MASAADMEGVLVMLHEKSAASVGEGNAASAEVRSVLRNRVTRKICWGRATEHGTPSLASMVNL